MESTPKIRGSCQKASQGQIHPGQVSVDNAPSKGLITQLSSLGLTPGDSSVFSLYHHARHTTQSPSNPELCPTKSFLSIYLEPLAALAGFSNFNHYENVKKNVNKV